MFILTFFQNVWQDILKDGWVVIFAILAIILNGMAYQMKTKRGILMTVVASTFTVSIYYFFKGAISGGLMNVLSILRSLTFDQRDRGRKGFNSIWILIGFLALFAGAGIYSGITNKEGLWAILSVVGMSLNTISMWVKKPSMVRMLSFPAMLCWFCYNLHFKLWLLVVSDIVCLSAIIVGYFRHDRKEN